MDLAWHWKFALVLGVSGSLLGCKSPFGGQTTQASAGANSNPLVKAWKSTSASVASALTIKPKTTPPSDPTSLGSEPPKISANTHIASGRLLESRQEFPKAQAEYEKAIKAEPTNLTALVSLARLQDRQGRPDQAIVTYQRALKAHPKSALLHNDLGLCYARKRDLASAVALLHKAVEMEPGKPNYRNNLATVLVEAGRTDEALKHLLAVHPPAAAHYNLAYLLNHRGQADVARRYLAQAVELDPSLAAAQEMLAQIGGGAAAAPSGQLENPPIEASGPAFTGAQVAPSALGAAPPKGVYDPGFPAQGYPPDGEMPVQTAEPVYHIGSEGIETSPADGSSVYPAGPASHSPTGYHLDDSGDEGVLVVTHLVYGTDKDPAPEPMALEDDESGDGQEPADEPTAEEPVNVKPVSSVPTLYPVVE